MSGGHIIIKRHAERIWYIFSALAVLIILLFTITLVALRIFGFQLFTITSGSMEPNLPVGSLIYSRPTDPNTLKEGDIITFMNDETTIVTHRISEVVTETNSTGEQVLKFRTKGDANSNVDGKLVHYKNVIGTPVVVMPFLGYLSYYIQHPPGIYVTLIIGTFLISLIIIPSVFKNRGKEQTAKVEV